MQARVTKDKRDARLLRFALLFLAIAIGIYFLMRALLTLVEPSRAFHIADNIPGRSLNSGASAQANARSSVSIDPSFDAFHRARKVVAVVEAAPIIGEDAPETDLNLTLTGRRASGDGNGSATLKLPDGSEDTFRQGETILRNVSLKAVYPTHIIISRGGVHERVTFERAPGILLQSEPVKNQQENSPTAPANPPIEKTAPLAPASKRLSQNVRKLTPGQNVTQETRQTLQKITPEEFFRAIRPSPVRQGQRVLGYRITSRNPSINLKELGFERGDLVTHIGGNDLRQGTPNFRNFLEQANQNPSLANLTVNRNGETLTLSLN